MKHTKPAKVRKGQRWRKPGAEPYTVEAVAGYGARVRGDTGWTAGPWLRSQILTDEYIGRVR